MLLSPVSHIGLHQEVNHIGLHQEVNHIGLHQDYCVRITFSCSIIFVT